MRMLLLFITMIFATSASAGLYKWVDNEGNVHYSQKKPRDKQFKRLKAPRPAPQGNKSLYQSETKQQKDSNIVETESTKNEEIRASNCVKAKKNLSNYQVYRRVRDKDGNVKTIDDNERAAKISQAKQAIAEFCN